MAEIKTNQIDNINPTAKIKNETKGTESPIGISKYEFCGILDKEKNPQDCEKESVFKEKSKEEFENQKVENENL